jgi:type III restriction enzyme
VDSLGVTYKDPVGNWRSMHPDFLFINEVDGKVVASIVDRHDHHLEDSLIKLKALARFASEYGSNFHRIEALAKSGDRMCVLDFQNEAVRSEIEATDKTPLELYDSDLAIDYDPAGA